MKTLVVSLLASAGLLFVSPIQAAEPVVLQPVHQTIVSTGAFALTQPAVRCYNGCSFHYFAPGDAFTADYSMVSPLDGYTYYVVTVDGQAGYVLRPLIVGYGT